MSTELQKHKSQEVEVFNVFNPVQFDTMQRMAKLFANSELVPDMYRESDKNPLHKAMANCTIALEISQRIGASPLMVMQNLVIIYGRPSWSSKFLIATVNTCGRFEPLQYKFTNLGRLGKVEYTEYVWAGGRKAPKTMEFDGTNIDNIQCVAYTTAKGSDKVLESSPIDIKMAIQEGWYTKNGSKWVTMARQMLMYRTASFWTNAYAPELSMGMSTAEELKDIIDVEFTEVKDKVEEKKAKEANKDEINMEEEIKKAENLGKDKPKPKQEEPPKGAPKKEAPQPKKEAPQPKGMFDQEKTEPSWVKR